MYLMYYSMCMQKIEIAIHWIGRSSTPLSDHWEIGIFTFHAPSHVFILLFAALPSALQPEFQFLIEASDLGNPSRSGFTEVIITKMTFTTTQTLSVVVYKATDKNFNGHCGLECNPIPFSLTSTADGDVTFINVEQNGRILNKTEILEIVRNPNSINYKDLEEGIATSLIEFFAKKYNLVRLNVTELSVLDEYRQKRSSIIDPGFLTAKYVFEVKTTDATLKELNPIQKNETIEFTKSSKFRLQTNQELSVLSGNNFIFSILSNFIAKFFKKSYPEISSLLQIYTELSSIVEKPWKV